MKNALWSNIFSNWQQEESQTVLTLKQVPIFSGLKPRELRAIENLVHVRTYQPGEMIFKRHAPGEGMYIILSGKVEIYLEPTPGERNVLATLSDGDFFGELSLLDDEARSAAAVAADATELLGFFRPDLLSLLERNPELGNKILINLARVISARLRKTNDLLTEAQQSRKHDDA
ncbi:MAG: cyclic nucleotide-binding domain-containing protein [Candidatus Neomarinimicrobiota bacterium]|nr:MAG: cyclic nucleotide-binding domain-containing protein [Candidatus Neomarinimicrobiota bacterium]